MPSQRKTSLQLLAGSLLSLLIGACSSAPNDSEQALQKGLDYPATQRGTTTADYHGHTISGPYQWLEQLHTAETLDWVTRQQQFTQQQLQQLTASRFVKERLTELWNVERVSAPIEVAGKIFYWRNDGLQAQADLYMQQSVDSAPLKVVDVNQFDPTGLTAITDFSVSPDGRYLAYALSETGSDWRIWQIKHVNSGEILNERIEGTKFTNISWYPDSKGFYYSRYPRTARGFDDNASVDVFYHSLGTDARDDVRVTELGYEPGVNPYPQVSSDGQFLLLRVQQGPNENRWYRRPLRQTAADFEPLLEQPQSEHQYLGTVDDVLYFYSHHQDGLGKVVSIQTTSASIETVIEEQDHPLTSVSLMGNQLVAHYLDNARSRVMTFDLQGRFVRELALPGMGSISGFEGHPDSTQAFFKYSSFTEAGKIYRYQVEQQRTSLWQQSSLPIDTSRYQTHQVFFSAADGTQVPMFIVHADEVKLDGNNPLLLHGYGGFGRTLRPEYQADFMAWLELGGVLAVANVRGGGAYGNPWHKAGIQNNKATAINDFIGAAQWLISQGYTRPDKLAVHGRGHGAMMAAAAMVQQPQLFSVVLAEVGVYDLLRYQTANANARAWQTEFGISSSADDFNALIQYSPLHNTRYGQCYPAMLLSTGQHDQRVAPWHSYKFAAQMQYVQGCPNPVLLDVDENAGHGDKTPIWMEIDRTQRQWAFALNQLQVGWLKNEKPK